MDTYYVTTFDYKKGKFQVCMSVLQLIFYTSNGNGHLSCFVGWVAMAFVYIIWQTGTCLLDT